MNHERQILCPMCHVLVREWWWLAAYPLRDAVRTLLGRDETLLGRESAPEHVSTAENKRSPVRGFAFPD